jgi:type IV pilus assembly protein PilE
MRQASHLPAQRGFTLLQILLAFAAVGLLTAWLWPITADYSRRGHMVSAFNGLLDYHLGLERYYLLASRYDDAAGACGYVAPTANSAGAFSFECVATGRDSYMVTARGVPGKSTEGFVYTIDQSDARRTTAAPPGWSNSDLCWIIRRDGACA